MNIEFEHVLIARRNSFKLTKRHIPDVEKLLEHLKGLEDDGE